MKRYLLRLLIASIVAAMTIGIGVAVAAELLSNGGFENATGGVPDDWSKYGGTLSQVSSPVRSGSYAASFTSDTSSTKWIYQVIAPITGGDSYTFSGYAVKNDSNITSVYLRISWYSSNDGDGTAIDDNDSTTSLTTDDSSYRFLTTESVTAPASARSARARIMLDPVSVTVATAYFDDMSFASNPTAITLSSFTAHPTASQPTFFRWPWVALAGAVVAFGGGAVARRSLRR